MEIRRLTAADLPACLALAAGRGWRADADRWRMLLATGEGHGIDDPDGGLAGTVVLTRYGAQLAVVGMMLVAARRERRGLGRRLMEHVLDRAGEAAVFLTATAYGRPLYERLGFRAAGALTTYVGDFAGAPPDVSRAATPADRPAILALDAAVYGADRGAVLAAQLARAEQVRVVERGGAVAAYAIAVRGEGLVTIGPVIGGDERLLADVAARASGPVRLDLDHRHDRLRAWAAEHGLAPDGTATLMVRGDRRLPWDRDRVTAPVMLALG